MERIERIRGMLLGLAVGDALGAPVENWSMARIQAEHGFLEDVIPFTHRWYRDRPAGQVTDDTMMTAALAEALIETGGVYDAQTVMDWYLHWYLTDGQGVGGLTRFVFDQTLQEADPVAANQAFFALRPGRAPGNGVLMRISPIVALFGDTDAMREAVTMDNDLTHCHPVARECALHYAHMLAAALDGQSVDSKDPRYPVASVIANVGNDTIGQITNGGGMAVTSLAACGYVMRADYESAMLWLLNKGGDTDSHMAISGALLGAMHGVDAVPRRWADCLRPGDEEYLSTLAEQLASTAETLQTA